MATGIVDINSPLIRRRWLSEGLIKELSERSFWTPMTGGSTNSIIYQVNKSDATTGHTVVFDFHSKLSGAPIEGKTTATGKGEVKKRFSDRITVKRYRHVVDNGDMFDTVESGAFNLSNHSDSRQKLASLFRRTKDQSIFDTLQGNMGQAPTHSADYAVGTFDYDSLIELAELLKTSNDFSKGAKRRPLEPTMTKDGRDCWYFVIDPSVATVIKQSEKYQSLVFNADVRGDNNRAIKGIIGKIDNLTIIEAPSFFGYSSNTTAHAVNGPGFKIDQTEVEMCGMRRRDSANLWSGQQGFSAAGAHVHRCLLLGAGAVQLAFGKQPDYQFQRSMDFGITSESCVEWWYNLKKTKLKTEVEDYKEAKVAGIDFGVISVDISIA